MRIVLEQSDLRDMSPGTRRELVERLLGKGRDGKLRRRSAPNLRWRRPLDLTENMATRLLHGLAEPHRRRLELFAKKGGRVRQRDLLAVTGDSDLRVLSHFQAVLTRRLRRFLDDPEQQIHLIGWDFGAEKWDDSHTTLVDGIYFVTDKTTKSLQHYFGVS